MSNNYKVYILTNNITKENYVGVTKQEVYRRVKAGKGYKLDTKINKAILKYGWGNFSYKIVYETKDKELAGLIEKDYIKKLDTINNGYNYQSGGFRNFSNPMKEEAKSKLKSIHKGKHYSKETEWKKGIYNETSRNKKIPILCIETNVEYESITNAEKELNISHHIWDCLKGKRNKCGGYHWKEIRGEE